MNKENKAYYGDIKGLNENRKAEVVTEVVQTISKDDNKGFKRGLLVGSLGATAVQSVLTIIVMLKMIF